MRPSIFLGPFCGVAIGACVLMLATSSTVRGQEAPDRALDCSAALASMAMAFKLNEPDKLPPIMADLEVWLNKLGKPNQPQVVPHFKRMDAQHGSRWSIDTAISCRNELHMATTAQCLQVVKERQDQAIWYFKAAAGQAALGRAIGGNIGSAQEDIRLGCNHIDYARAKLREMNCEERVIEVMDQTWRNYVLDVPGPKGNARLACLGNGN